MKIKIRNSRGEILDHDDALPIPDQCGLYIPAFLMDADPVQRAIASSRSTSRAVITDSLGREAGHRPGHCYARDDDEAEARAQASYLASKARLADAWRGSNVSLAQARGAWPGAWHNMVNPPPQPTGRAPHDAAIAREAWKARVSSAWQTDAAGNNPAWPSGWSGPEPYKKPKDKTLEVDEARARYKAEIQNMWKSKPAPPTDLSERLPLGPWVDRNPDRKPPDRSLNDADSAWHQMVARQANAWKSPGAA